MFDMFAITSEPIYSSLRYLKGLGHVVLGNFSTDQMPIEFSKISQKRLKTTEDLKENTGKPRGDMDGQNWRLLKWMAF